MKYAISILIILSLACYTGTDNAYAQNVRMGPQVERNIQGIQFGLSASYVSGKSFALGFYHQLEANVYRESSGRYAREINGLILDFPIVIDKKLSLVGRLKPSLANRQFFLVIPATEMQFRAVRFLFVAGEISYRAGYPAFAIKTNVIINHKKQQL